MSDHEALAESIIQNRRYLAYAKKALSEVQGLANDLDAQSSGDVSRYFGSEIGNKAIENNNMGLYKKQHNGKGWKKLAI